MMSDRRTAGHAAIAKGIDDGVWRNRGKRMDGWSSRPSKRLQDVTAFRPSHREI